MQAIKRTLHTTVLEEAQLRAATLASHYERLFARLRDDGLDRRSRQTLPHCWHPPLLQYPSAT
ncbi:hypothetical protein O1K_10147 [Xanthomonas fragariae LMG 25863]|nr:hypothetical protein O1K_10147 [Xanthomonas fragariae LMG 25863]